jgi:hypothetical protein
VRVPQKRVISNFFISAGPVSSYKRTEREKFIDNQIGRRERERETLLTVNR